MFVQLLNTDTYNYYLTLPEKLVYSGFNIRLVTPKLFYNLAVGTALHLDTQSNLIKFNIDIL